MKCGGSSRCVRLGCELEPWKARIAAQGVVHHATAHNKTVAAYARCARFGEHGSHSEPRWQPRTLCKIVQIE